MSSSRTPRLDALVRWIEGGRLGEIEWPVDPLDPCDGLDDEQRSEYVLRSCASGAPAELGVPAATIGDMVVPAPPHHRPARGPRGRSPRGRGAGPVDDS